MKKLVQWIIILVCWFTLSPLFYYLAKKWKLLRTLWRVVLLLISPLFWLLHIILLSVLINLADDMYRRFQFRDHETIAEITKSPFPSYMVLYHYPEYGNYRVYADSKDFMFYRLPSDSFYQAIDSLTLIENSGWRLEINNKYTYEKSLHWNIGMPFIEKYFYCDAYVFYLVIKIEKGNRFGHMHYRVCRNWWAKSSPSRESLTRFFCLIEDFYLYLYILMTHEVYQLHIKPYSLNRVIRLLFCKISK